MLYKLTLLAQSSGGRLSSLPGLAGAQPVLLGWPGRSHTRCSSTRRLQTGGARSTPGLKYQLRTRGVCDITSVEMASQCRSASPALPWPPTTEHRHILSWPTPSSSTELSKGHPCNTGRCSQPCCHPWADPDIWHSSGMSPPCCNHSPDSRAPSLNLPALPSRR